MCRRLRQGLLEVVDGSAGDAGGVDRLDPLKGGAREQGLLDDGAQLAPVSEAVVSSVIRSTLRWVRM